MRDQETVVMKALAQHRLKPVKIARQGKWIAALVRKATRSS
jgi:hypothetical protein